MTENSKVIDFAEAQEENTPHGSGNAKCMACQHEWVAVAPLGTVWLECPECHLTQGHFVYTFCRWEDRHWTCDCGNDMFHMTPAGFYCPRCGNWQDTGGLKSS